MLSYVLKTGFKNLGAKKLFSFASICTIACSVFVFCLFFVIGTNIHGIINKVESTVGIQVFFDEGLSEDYIQEIANKNFHKDYVKSLKFKSSNQAWEEFKNEYFDNRVELASAFENDNPLVNSSSYEILLTDITKQYEYVQYLTSIEGVRQVNYSNVLIDTLTSLSFSITSFSIILIALLLLIAIIIISNTISIASQFRKKENEIMKLIGATNFMIRAPFVIEGFLIGFFGSIIPVSIVCGFYNYLMNLIIKKAPFIANIFEPIDLVFIAPPMVILSISFACFVCMIVSFFTIRKHLKV